MHIIPPIPPNIYSFFGAILIVFKYINDITFLLKIII
jgi:hypothetical protein